jgi:peroxiredoxin Q/BCP
LQRYLTMAMMAIHSLFPVSVFGLAVGQPAPDFVAPSTQGPIRLGEYAGKRAVVLAVYYKDFTPG